MFSCAIRRHMYLWIVFALLMVSLCIYMYEQENAQTKVTNNGMELFRNNATGFQEIHDLVTVASRISRHNAPVLMTVVNRAFIPFAHSWLCNTNEMEVHKHILVVTTEIETKFKLVEMWPKLNVVALDLSVAKENQTYQHAGYLKIMNRRTELIHQLLRNGIELCLFEFDAVWFSNPIPLLHSFSAVDMLVNPVSRSNMVNGGFIYLFATEKTTKLWRKLTEKMQSLAKRLEKYSDNDSVKFSDNDQEYLSELVRNGYANITTKILPLSTYADGVWYSREHLFRNTSHPIIIFNNFIIGNPNKIKRAKKWNHWFLLQNNSCNLDLVRRTVYR